MQNQFHQSHKASNENGEKDIVLGKISCGRSSSCCGSCCICSSSSSSSSSSGSSSSSSRISR